jgi:hypothetical protein
MNKCELNVRKPANYWSYEMCKSESLKYNNRNEFKKKCSSAYNIIMKYKWLELIEPLLTTKPNGYWTKEMCKKEALKYNSRTNFRNNSVSAYTISRKNLWLDELCAHIPSKTEHHKSNDYWSYNRCKEEILKYTSYTEFRKKSNNVYKISGKKGWRDELCNHFHKEGDKKYYSYELCKEIALKYQSKSEFLKNDKKCYKKIVEKKWSSDLCSHMTDFGDWYNRVIYKYEFEDKSVYIGLTYDIIKRNYSHLKHTSSSVYRHMVKTSLIPTLTQLTNLLSIVDAKNMEEFYVNKYREEGYNILNIKKTGGIGSIKKSKDLTYDECLEESLKYDNRTDFQSLSPRYYTTSRKNKWLNDFYIRRSEKRK